MPQQYDDDFDDDGDGYDSRGDSDLVKNLRRQLKEANKALSERDARISTLEGSVRERTVADVLTAKGVNPKVAGLMPKDLEPTPEAVEQWIADYADVFNIQVGEAPAEQATEPDPTLAAYDRVRAVEGSGTPVAGEDALAQKLANASNEAELMALIASRGA